MKAWLDRLGLSEEQAVALRDHSPRLLVAAGAGSGKTRLLVAFFLQALLEAELPMEKVVAVTFTRKAGAEMAVRIRAALEDLGCPALARALDSAVIGTIHGLCHRILRDQALAAGVEPGFGVLESEAAKLVKDQLSRQAWAEAVEAAAEDELRVFAARGDAFRKEMVGLYDRLRGLGFVFPQVVIEPDGSCGGSGVSGDGEARPSDGDAESTLQELIERGQELLAKARDQRKPSETLSDNCQKVEQSLNYFQRVTAGQELEALEASKDFFLSQNVSADLKPAVETFNQALTAHRNALAQVPLRALVRAMNLLLTSFHRLYREFKQARGVLDFADLELYTKALLASRAASEATPPLFEGAWVLVDEFQDTNELQCSILERSEAARLIMVGDERQSIYRFRGADVEVFRRRLESMQQGLHQLNINFRSRGEVLAFVDRLFAHHEFFGAEMRPMTAWRDLGPAASQTASCSVWPPVQIYLVERSARTQGAEGEKSSTSYQEAEAAVVAQVVGRLLHEDGLSPADVALLLPAMSQVEAYEEALSAEGIEVYVVRGKGYFSREEVYDVGGLLKLLVNPHDDVAFCTVARSPLVEMSDDALYLLGRRAKQVDAPSLWAALAEGGEEVLPVADRGAASLLRERLGALRKWVGRPGLSRLIDEAVSLFEYDLHLLGREDGKRRYANVRKLMRMAASFEELNGPDLAGFVELLEDMEELGDDEGSAPSLSENEQVLRIMTVHQAKGLEFPVVVLAGLGGELSKDSRPDIVVGQDGRMGVFLRHSKRKTYEDDDFCAGPAAAIWKEQGGLDEQEALRLLYVAMTRAQDALILVGALPKAGSKEDRWIGRILKGLDLEAEPVPGETVQVPGLEATVTKAVPEERSTRPQGEVSVAGASAPRPPLSPAHLSGSADEEAGPSRGLSAGVPETEAPGVLVLPRTTGGLRRLSFSALALYRECPRRFYWERVLGLGPLSAGRPEEGLQAGSAESTSLAGGGDKAGQSAGGEPELSPSEDWPDLVVDGAEAASGRDVGLLVHGLLEVLDLQGPAPASDRSELAALAEAIAQERGLVIGREAQERAIRLAADFWRSPVRADLVRAGEETVRRELPFACQEQGMLLTGVYDLTWEEPGEIRRIVDYKTNALGGRAPAEAVEPYRLQAEVYGLAALRGGARRVRLDFVFLEKPEEPVTFECAAADEARLAESVRALLAGIQAGQFPAVRGTHCPSCVVSRVCAASSDRV